MSVSVVGLKPFRPIWNRDAMPSINAITGTAPHQRNMGGYRCITGTSPLVTAALPALPLVLVYSLRVQKLVFTGISYSQIQAGPMLPATGALVTA